MEVQGDEEMKRQQVPILAKTQYIEFMDFHFEEW
jgi:hypothetical protein